MPHSFVVARFNPARTAEWLSPSGRLAAAKLSTQPFWAIRFETNDETSTMPRQLCAVSSQPSPLHIPNATLILGPKMSLDSGAMLWSPAEGAQLTVEPPIYCYESTLHQPLYLHTVPAMLIGLGGGAPIRFPSHRLEDDSLSRFKKAVDENQYKILNFWTAQREVYWLERLPHPPDIAPEDLLDTVFSGYPDPTYVFGERNNPRMYAFDFPSSALPAYDFPAPVYDEIYLYSQLCRDYRWWGAEATIAWVRTMRATTLVADSSTISSPIPSFVSVVHTSKEEDVQDLLKRDADFLAKARMLARVSFDEPGDSDDESESTSKVSDASGPGKPDSCDKSDVIWLHMLPWAFPLLPLAYPRIALPRSPSVVVLDMLGVLLDREGTLNRALERWMPLACRPQDIMDAVKLYIELEALAARKHSACATSLGTVIHSALGALATTLDLPPSWRSVFLADAAATILGPRLHNDIAPAVDALTRQGCAVVALVPWSASTLDVLRPAFSTRPLDALYFYPAAIPVHFPVPNTFFPGLLQWCRRTLERPDLSAQNVVIAGGGVGRLLAPASVHGHPTVLVRRPESVECHVDFVVGEGETTPHLSAVVEGLDGLCRALVEQ